MFFTEPTDLVSVVNGILWLENAPPLRAHRPRVGGERHSARSALDCVERVKRSCRFPGELRRGGIPAAQDESRRGAQQVRDLGTTNGHEGTRILRRFFLQKERKGLRGGAAFLPHRMSPGAERNRCVQIFSTTDQPELNLDVVFY